jgi:hypothetical protein
MASRQAEWQRRHKALGLCILCSQQRFKNDRCVKHYEANRKRRQEGAVVACCGEMGRKRVSYYLALKRVAAAAEAPETQRAEARAVLKREFHEDVA